MWVNPYSGIFFCWSGIDFCGKSTQVVRTCNWLRAKLKDKSVEVVATKQPTTDHFGKRIRTILADKEFFAKTDPFDLQELFSKDSRAHCEREVVPHLKRGHIVCTDRFRESMVYGADRHNLIDLHMLVEMNQMYHNGFWVWPDKVFILDLLPELAIERGRASGRQFDEMEKVDTLHRVRDNFQMFHKEYPMANLHFIDASRSLEEVFADIRKEIEVTLKAKGFELEI